MSKSTYWNGKGERAHEALSHTRIMSKFYSQEIVSCINNSVVFRGENNNVGTGTPEIVLTKHDTVTEIHRQDVYNCVALNFASYRNAGGGYLKGAMAQEECLCMESWLYNVLSEMDDYYAYNEAHLQNGLYENAAIYTPDVGFMRSKGYKSCDILTCAAPNYSHAERLGVSRAENRETLISRMRFIRGILEEACVETFIVGAWRCGVFKQEPEEVAQLFLDTFVGHASLKKLIFAIPIDRSAKNYNAFAKVISGYLK